MKNIISVIKNDGPSDALVYKSPNEDFNTNAQLIVGEAEEALFVKNGMVVQVFSGGRYTLNTGNFPFLSELKNKLLSGGVSPFHCEVYFVSKAHRLELKWGTDSPLQVRDAEFGFMVNVRARGSYSVQVAESKKFLLKLLGSHTDYYTAADVEKSFRSAFLSEVKTVLGRVMRDLKYTVLDIAPELTNIAAQIRPQLAETLAEYGLNLVHFYIVDVSIPDSDPNYAKINNAYAEKGTVRIQGPDWDRITSKEILKDVAANPGAGGMGAGIGLGLGALGAMHGMGAQAFQPASPQPSGGSFCTQCGAQNPAGSRFCAKCGKPVSAARVCPKCGQPAEEGAFCRGCGEKLP